MTMWHAVTDWAFELHEAHRGIKLDEWQQEVFAACPAFRILNDQAVTVKHRRLGKPVGRLESTHTSTPVFIGMSVGGPDYYQGTRVIRFEQDKMMTHHWRVDGHDVDITPILETCLAFLRGYVERVEPI